MFDDILGNQEEQFYEDAIEFEYYGDTVAGEPEKPRGPKVIDLSDLIDDESLSEAIDKIIEEALKIRGDGDCCDDEGCNCSDDDGCSDCVTALFEARNYLNDNGQECCGNCDCRINSEDSCGCECHERPVAFGI